MSPDEDKYQALQAVPFTAPQGRIKGGDVRIKRLITLP
jgi:hypothetical protein